ncbi:xanthine dehydrogenase family protein molybdopterin-binding subunit [Arthrobacter psychrochitiniphilus]|uniref:Carbon monoxide dehydrogenase n=1 Tax=Arthrobacter psychrochitiniphilus TaxID=291045 RepID=A0A2V3DMI6_9MICC|nr:xanthine dehydrogenase family protein molybdopterin-binding subunit [Arthrobacter psychrochitiniphilus]NYG17914.1 CO/xanthine dehydrogenase Mo-binding subunit [Arthrobacter psychrochitiniphilus]PXA64120.1 carbon monoxide dehydrogenase [Arthrobacter psychrochitiniphilus]
MNSTIPSPRETNTHHAFGQPRETIESARHVRGGGKFVADLQLPGMLHVALLRSPKAHARIVEIDVRQARSLLGVHAILTGADVQKSTSSIYTMAQMHKPPLDIPLHALATDKVRHVGEPVVAVAARTRAIAEDAVRLIRVKYEDLPPVADADAALASGAPLVHENIAGNLIMHRQHDFGDAESVFKNADHVVRRKLRWPRQTGAALETFGCVAQWQPGVDELTFWSNHQSNVLLWTLGPTLGLPPHRIKGIACDIGGAFGAKFWQPRAMVICALFSRLTTRPVRYVEGRVENLVGGDNHGEDRTYDAELALDSSGKMLGLRFSVVEDYGSAFILGPINNAEPLAQATGPYDIAAFAFDFTAVLSNKVPQAAYRGFGGAAHNFMLERLVDAAAVELGLSAVAIRELNLLQPEQFPYRTATGNIYDSGDYPTALHRAVKESSYDLWRERQARAREVKDPTRAIGIGLVSCQERSVQSGTALWLMFDQEPGRNTTAAESASVRIDSQGSVRVALHSPSLGTPTETIAATVVAEELGVPADSVSVSRLDTSMAGPAMGPSASRMTVMLSGAVAGAVREVIEKMRPLAAHLLEANPEDLMWDPSRACFTIVGVPESSATLAAIAHLANGHALRLPAGCRSGLESTYTYDHPMSSMPHADGSDWGNYAPIVGHTVHVPVVEVDLQTGAVTFLDYFVMHDCGTVVNPDAVRGQVVGATVQGIATALTEELAFDEQARPQNTDFRSYFLPTFLDVPAIRLGHMETPSPFTYRGVKGIGEGGRMAAPAAVVSAIEDALSPYGVRINEVPVTPEKILKWLGNASAAQ